jgi:hypothetical protein
MKLKLALQKRRWSAAYILVASQQAIISATIDRLHVDAVGTGTTRGTIGRSMIASSVSVTTRGNRT